MARLLAILLLVSLFQVPALADATNPVVTVLVLPDGSCQIEGQRFSDGKALKVKLDEIEHRTPKPGFAIALSRKDIDFKSLGHVILLLQQAGVPKIGFLIEPARQ